MCVARIEIEKNEMMWMNGKSYCVGFSVLDLGWILNEIYEMWGIINDLCDSVSFGLGLLKDCKILRVEGILQNHCG